MSCFHRLGVELKSEEWEVSNFISEQYLGHQYPRLSGMWPQHQPLLIFCLDSDPSTAMFVADPADRCQQDSWHAPSNLREVHRTLAIHLPCSPQTKKHTKTPATFFCLFFFNYSFIFKLHKQCELVQYLRK